MKKLVLFSVIVGLAFVLNSIQPPPPKICSSPEGPPVTGPRIKLKDGRNLAYKEQGIPREMAKFKIIFVHGVDSRHEQELFEEMGRYILSFDRPDYGESDPNLKVTEKSIALDIEELTDQLGLGSKFYIIGFSLGGEITCSCLKYIPHRATLIAPVVNYWWSGHPANLAKETYTGSRCKTSGLSVSVTTFLG